MLNSSLHPRDSQQSGLREMNKLAKVMSLVEMLKGDKSVPIPLCHRLRSEGCALVSIEQLGHDDCRSIERTELYEFLNKGE